MCQIGYNAPSDGDPRENTVSITVWDSEAAADAHVAKDCRDSWEGMMNTSVTDDNPEGIPPMPADDEEVVTMYYDENGPTGNYYRIDMMEVGTK